MNLDLLTNAEKNNLILKQDKTIQAFKKYDKERKAYYASTLKENERLSQEVNNLQYVIDDLKSEMTEYIEGDSNQILLNKIEQLRSKIKEQKEQLKVLNNKITLLNNSEKVNKLTDSQVNSISKSLQQMQTIESLRLSKKNLQKTVSELIYSVCQKDKAQEYIERAIKACEARIVVKTTAVKVANTDEEFVLAKFGKQLGTTLIDWVKSYPQYKGQWSEYITTYAECSKDLKLQAWELFKYNLKKENITDRI